MNDFPSDIELCKFFGVEAEYDGPEDKDWNEFFSNTHFTISNNELTLVFSKSETFEDCQILLYSSDRLVLSMTFLGPIAVRITDNSMNIVKQNGYIVMLEINPGISIRMDAQSS